MKNGRGGNVPNQHTWQSKDGPIVISKMSDSHLLNTIRFLRRWHRQEMRNAAVLADHLGLDDMTTEIDFDEDEDDEYHAIVRQHPAYATMLNEAEKRGLDYD